MRWQFLVLLLCGCPVAEQSPPTATPVEPDDDDATQPDCLPGDWPDCDNRGEPWTYSLRLSLELGPGELNEPVDAYASLTVFRWLDVEAGILDCRQDFDISGAFRASSVAGCSRCVGLVVFDPASVQDRTDPAISGDACDPTWRQGEGLSLGRALLAPRPDGYGDLLRLGLLLAETHAEMDTDWSVNGGMGLNDFMAAMAPGQQYSLLGFLERAEGTYAASIGLDQVAVPAEPDSRWLPFWRLGVDVSGEAGLPGTHRGEGLWHFLAY